MKTRLIFSTVALAIAGWCHATGYTLTLYADGCESANVIKCDVNQQVNITAVPENEQRHFVHWSDGSTDNPRLITVTQDMTLTAVFAYDQYTIIAFGEYGTVEGTGTYDAGTVVYLTAVPDKHYHFVKWNDGNTDNPRLLMVESNTYLSAEFAIDQFTISATGEYGRIEGMGTYDYGTTVTLTAIADEHYHFTQWSDGNTDNPRTVSVEGDATYTAEFLLNEYTITVLYDNIKGYVSGGGTYDYGTTTTLTATANEHYHFTQWSDGNTDNPRLITVTQDMTLTAVFAYDQYTITASGEHGTVGGTGMYDYNTMVYLTAVPDKGYHFVKWDDGNTDNPRLLMVESNTIYTAEFAIDQFTISATGEYGCIEGTGTYDYGTTATLTATANEHYHFTRWTDGNTDNPRTLMVEGNATYTAEFAIDQFTISATGEYGRIEGTGTYDYGTTATLTATANEHYHFTRWTDGNTDNPRTVSVVGDATYIAEFKPNSYTITVSAGEHGNVSGAGTYDYGTTATLTATADEHYHFTQWTDGNTDNPRTISVEGDATYTAEFLLNKYTITVLYDNTKGYVSGGGTYVYGTQVRLEVSANSGYEFAQWSNGATYNPYLLTATADLTLEAQFVPATAVDNVSADGTTPQKIVRDGQVYILRNGKTYTTTGVEVK